MKRKFLIILENWYRENRQEPLLIIGARQVGKTYLAESFCRQTSRELIALNFELHGDYASIFEDTLDPVQIIKRLEALMDRAIDPDRCIFFFDEIQRCERAITSLKYFCESETDYRIICAGSLLGVKLERFTSSFPVGKVIIRTMVPMDFEEFLWAVASDRLVEQIRSCYEKMQQLPEALHQKALSLYHDYLYIGGMPQAVLSYSENGKDAMRFDRNIHRSIITSYLADMRKHTFHASEAVKIAEVYESLPRQLAKENPKFQYKEIAKGADKRGYQSALSWLKAAEIVCEVKRTSLTESPLAAYAEEGYFKIYYSDVGLLSSSVSLPYREIIGEVPGMFRGALTENYVAQSLHANGIPLFYYQPSRSMEIDFLLDLQGDIIPLEVKAGRHKHSASLRAYFAAHQPAYGIRLSALNFGRHENLYSIPLYAVFCIGSGA